MPFVSLLWIGFLIFVAVNSSKKQKKTGSTTSTRVHRPAPAPIFKPADSSPVAEQISFEQAFAEGEDPCHEDDLRGPDAAKPSIYQAEPHSSSGSMHMDSEEGIDTCHSAQASFMTFAELEDNQFDSSENTPVESSLQMNWNGNEVLRAVVMQEVLKRPCERR